MISKRHVDWQEMSEKAKCSIALNLFRDDLIEIIEASQKITNKQQFKQYFKCLRKANTAPWMQVVAMKICLKKYMDFRLTKAFIKWCDKYKDEII